METVASLSNSIALIAVAAMFGVEAWKANGRIPRVILTALVVIFVLSAVFLKLLSDAVPKVGTLVAATFSSPVSWFALALSIFFVARPYWTVSATSQTIATSEDASLEALRSETKQTVLSQTQYVNALDARIERLTERIDRRLETDLTQMALTAGELAGFKAETEKRLLANDYAFAAIGHREVLLDRASKLEQYADALSLEAHGDSLAPNDEWAKWETEYKCWRGALEDWLIFASPYCRDLQVVKKLPDNIHKLSWTFGDTQFPDSAAIHEYRSFCVIHHNWNDIKDKVHAAVRKVAFEGKLPVNAKQE